MVNRQLRIVEFASFQARAGTSSVAFGRRSFARSSSRHLIRIKHARPQQWGLACSSKRQVLRTDQSCRPHLPASASFSLYIPPAKSTWSSVQSPPLRWASTSKCLRLRSGVPSTVQPAFFTAASTARMGGHIPVLVHRAVVRLPVLNLDETATLLAMRVSLSRSDGIQSGSMGTNPHTSSRRGAHSFTRPPSKARRNRLTPPQPAAARPAPA